MKRLLVTYGLLLGTIAGHAQATVGKIYSRADSLLRANDIAAAYTLCKQLKPRLHPSDSLYKPVLWYYLGTATELGRQRQMREDFAAALQYNLESLKLIQENKLLFDSKFADRESWMIKNVVVSYFGLGKVDEAAKYKALLYSAYQAKQLPESIGSHFNFDFFTAGGNNVWGYEWYPELPDNRFGSSFTKVVYYVYSRKADGSDDQPLYRFHVLMFHQDAKDAKFAYVLERQQATEQATISGTYYQYTYQENIDYRKLREDVKRLVVSGQEPDSRRIIPQRK